MKLQARIFIVLYHVYRIYHVAHDYLDAVLFVYLSLRSPHAESRPIRLSRLANPLETALTNLLNLTTAQESPTDLE